MHESEIFLAASQIEDLVLRATFLDSACQGNEGLRQRLEMLLRRFQRWEGAVERFAEGLPDIVADIRQDEQSALAPQAREELGNGGLQAGTQIKQYEITSCLGIGGMGRVYLAEDTRLNRSVALKLLPPNRNEDVEWVRRLKGEAQAVSKLNHPNILTVYEIDQHDGFHYIVTEFIDGLTLRSYIDQNVLTLAKKIRYGIEIARALHVAHSAGIIHRDLKPENIMVRQDGLLKVLDFGLAKHFEGGDSTSPNRGALSQVATHTGLMLGTVRYMSPEQARCQPLDYRSDIFSLGILLYELLTGRLPFSGSNDADVLASILHKEPGAMASNEAPAELRRLLMAMLRKDRETRLLSAREVAVELELILEQTYPAPSKVLSIRASDRGHGVDHFLEANSDDHFDTPEVHYARSGQVNIAYQVLGSGDIDIVFVMGWVSHLDWFWKEPSFAKFLRHLASFSRLILFDKRGTGLSDRVPEEQLPTLEQRMDDVRAVMDAVGSDRAVLCGVSEGGPMCSLFAATYPEKTTALVMIGSYARRLRTENYPWGPSPEQHAQFLEDIRRQWGGPVGIETRAPSCANDPLFRSWWATYLRMGASPGAALALTRMNSQIDIRPILKTIQVPTLVVHRSGDKCLLVAEGKYLADNIPGAKFVELPGNDHLPFVGAQDDILEPIEKFLTGVSRDNHVKRVLATVVYVQFARSENAPEHDSQLVAVAHAIREVELFRGRSFQNSGDLVTATFDGPARAIRAAMAIQGSAQRLGVALRIGVHTGECDETDQNVRGPAIESARWVTNQAQLGEILVSSTVKDLVAGADLNFSVHLIDTADNNNNPSKLFKVE